MLNQRKESQKWESDETQSRNQQQQYFFGCSEDKSAQLVCISIKAIVNKLEKKIFSS